MRQWWGSLRLATRIARRDALRAKGRTALVAVLVGLPVLAGSAAAVILHSEEPTSATYARWHLGDEAQALIGSSYGVDLTQTPRGDGAESQGSANEAPLSDYERSLQAVLPEGDALVRVLRGTVGLSTSEQGVREAFPATEMPRQQGLAGIDEVADGAFPAGPGEVALAPDLAKRLGIRIGDAVTLAPTGGEPVTAAVTGVLAPAPIGPEVVAAPGWLFRAPDTASSGTAWAEWYVTGPTPVTWRNVLAINHVGSIVTSRAVLLEPPDRSEVPYWSTGYGSPDPSSKTLSLWAAVAAIALLETVLLVGPAFAVSARRSERQLALLAAAGAERRTLRHVVLQTGLVTGLAASLIGAGLGVAIAAGIRAVMRAQGTLFVLPDLRVPIPALAGLVALGAVIGVGAAWFPAHRAARLDVVAVLGGRRTETRLRRGVPIAGVVVFAAGTVAAFAGAITSRWPLLLGGVVAVDLGVIAASGALLSVAGRLAPRLGVAGRLALRDAARQRGRSAPAVAAVLAAIAGMVAGVTFIDSMRARDELLWRPYSAEGVVAVSIPGASSTGYDEERGRKATESAVRTTLPVTGIVPVLFTAPIPGRVPDGATFELGTQIPPDKQCPLFADRVLSDAEIQVARQDPRCPYEMGDWTGQTIWTSEHPNAVLVDDGTIVAALGLPGSQDAVDALRAGKAVVNSEQALWPDGTTRLQAGYWSTTTDAQAYTDLGTASVPAVAVPQLGPRYTLILPPSALPTLGLTSQMVGLVAPTSRLATDAEEAAAVAAIGSDARLYIERGAPSSPNLAVLTLVLAALLVGLAATGIAVALAAAESRADLATLGAVGASPRMRRRFAAAQAGVISVIGVGMGIGAGLVLGRVLMLAEKARYAPDNLVWPVVTPWSELGAIGIGLPLITMLGAFLLTRSRLPMVRRIAA
jgi:putative ABC transport system permease protein